MTKSENAESTPVVAEAVVASRLLKNFGRAGFGKGTTFSRAVKSFKTSRASAPEVRFR